ADPQLSVTHLRVRTLRDIEMAEHGLELSHRGLPSTPCAHTLSFLCGLTLDRTSESSNGGACCPSRCCAYLAVAVARVCPRGMVHHGSRHRRQHRPIDVSPVRPAGPPCGPCWRMTRLAGMASREECGHVKPLAVLVRWRERGDRLPAPRAPARRLRRLQAARGPEPRPRQDSRPPPGAPGRACGGAPRTRRAGTLYRRGPRGSLGGSRPLRVCHSRPCANARG